MFPLVFVEAQKASKAMLAYERALKWQELFELASRNNILEDEMVSLAYRVAGEFSVRG